MISHSKMIIQNIHQHISPKTSRRWLPTTSPVYIFNVQIIGALETAFQLPHICAPLHHLYNKQIYTWIQRYVAFTSNNSSTHHKPSVVTYGDLGLIQIIGDLKMTKNMFSFSFFSPRNICVNDSSPWIPSTMCSLPFLHLIRAYSRNKPLPVVTSCFKPL